MDKGGTGALALRFMRRPSDPDPYLGAAIVRLRGKRTQEDLADACGLTAPSLSRIETGTIDPHWATVRRIAGALGVSAAQLATLAEEISRER